MTEIPFEQAHKLILAGVKVDASESRNEHGHSVFRYFVNCTHNEMVPNDSPTHAWKCAACGYVYGGEGR